MTNVDENTEVEGPVIERYRCGWCGAPTNKDGCALPFIPKEYLPFWDGAISVNGKCCETDIKNQEEYEHEMLNNLYSDT